jgi:hypothetical protein
MPRFVSVSLFRLFAAACLSFLLIGCGSGNGPDQILDSPRPEVGLLVDSAVAGVTFKTATQTGVTNALGEYKYVDGEMVTFSIGGIVLGVIKGAPILTPVELTASADPTNQAVLNLLVFLQSIDEDRDHTNGITISPAARNAAASMNLDFKAPDFSTRIAAIVSQVTGGANTVVSETVALQNFYDTYVQFGGTTTLKFQFPGFPPVGGGASTGTSLVSWDEDPSPVSGIGAFGDAAPGVAAAPIGGLGMALKLDRSGTAAFGGTYFNIAPAVPFATDRKTITARVYATRANAVVYLKVEGTGPAAEVAATVTAANTWQTLTWVMAGVDPTASYGVMVISADTDVAIGGAQTYWIDDINLADAAGGPEPPTPDTTDYVYATDLSNTPNWAAEIDFDYSDWGTQDGANGIFEGGFAGDADYNPVWQAKGADGQWGSVLAMAGFTAGFASEYETLVFKVRLDGSADSTVSVKFPAATTEQRVYDTAAVGTALSNGWYQMEVALADFGSVSAVSEFAIFTAQANTMYLTDIGFSGTSGGGPGGGGPGVQLDLNGDFEAGDGDLSDWVVEPNGGTIAAVDTQDSGSVWSVKLAADGSGGSPFISLAGLGAAEVLPGDDIYVSFDMCGSLEGDGGGVKIALLSEKGEGNGSDRATLEEFVANPPPSVWTRYEYTTQASANVTDGVSLQLEAVCGPVSGCGVNVYFDNVSIILGGDAPASQAASGASCAAPPVPGVTLPIDFEDALDASYVFLDGDTAGGGGFGGGQVSIETNSQSAGINTSANVAKMLKFAGQVYGGSTFDLGGTLTVPANTTFTMNVWSSREVPVLFKLEGGLVGEVTATHTGSSTWEELTFDFTSVGEGSITGITFIFDNGVNGGAAVDPGNWTFYFDGIDFAPAPPAPNVTLFADAFAPGWVGFLDASGTVTQVTDSDSTYGEVLEITTGGSTVVGIGSRTTVNGGDGVTIDTSRFAVLEFDLKLVTAPATTVWKLKVENPGVEIDIAAPVPGEWVRYSIPIGTLGTPDALDLIMLFADYGANAGAVYRLDNVKLLEEASPPPAQDITLFADAFASGWVGFLDASGSVTQVTDSNSTYGEVLEITTGGNTVVGLGSRTTVNGGDGVTIDTSGYAVLEFDLKLVTAPGTTNWRLKTENPGVEIGIDTPVLGTWKPYSIPLSTLGTPDALDLIMLFPDYGQNAGAVYRLDNVKLLVTSSDPGPGPASGELTTNGGFETGDFTGAEQFTNTGAQEISSVNPEAGTYSARLFVANANGDTVLKFSNLAPGGFTAGQTLNVSFDMRGTLSPGGVGFAEFFSEQTGGGTSKAEILFGNGPIFPSADPDVWTTFSTTVTTGTDTSGGVTLQLKVASGASTNAELFFDNVSVSVP